MPFQAATYVQPTLRVGKSRLHRAVNSTNSTHISIVTALLLACSLFCQPLKAEQAPAITLRTLAQIQQWQDEMNLRDRLDALQVRKRERGSNLTASPGGLQTRMQNESDMRTSPVAYQSQNISRAEAQPSDSTAQSANTHRKQRPTSQRRPALKLLSVYGPTHRLQAETQDAAGQVHALEEKDTVGRWIVKNIRHEGILLHREDAFAAKDKGIFIAVGESVDEGLKP